MSEDNISRRAIQAVISGQLAFCKFLSANDTGETGGHQSGIYIPKPAVPIIFENEFDRGLNHDRWAEIVWHDQKTTKNRFIYYGQGTRNEYRITNFGRGFEYLTPEHTGDLFVLVRIDYENYFGFILTSDDDIDEFLNEFSLSPTDTGRLINVKDELTQPSELKEFEQYFLSLKDGFPTTAQMSEKAREIDLLINNRNYEIISNPDKKIINWSEIEYKLFKYIENAYYLKTYNNGFSTIDEFLKAANSLLQRRKSRAGKSLEHHLSFIFTQNKLKFDEQRKTEGNKKPDFVFPGISEYFDPSFPQEQLYFLAAKTTCKDRWRQILNEADKIPVKHLFTLQQGISGQQLVEMQKSDVVLVVPESNLDAFPKVHRASILTLKKFIKKVKN